MEELSVWKPKFRRGGYFSSMLVASRKSGKSYLVKYLLQEHLMGLYHLTVIMCPSIDDLEEYNSCIGKFPKKLCSKYDEQYLERLVLRNEERMIKGKKPIETLVLIDDSSGVDTRNSDMLFKLYTRGRHAGISVIFICQEYTSLKPGIRNNVELWILLRQLSTNGRVKAAEEVLSGSNRLDSSINEKKFYLDLQDDYAREVGDALIVDKRGEDDGLFYFRAPDGLEFKRKSTIEEKSETSDSEENSEEKDEFDEENSESSDSEEKDEENEDCIIL